MVVQDIKTLLEKLDERSTQALEQAVGLCVSRGHYEVRWEHLFISLCRSNEEGIGAILQHFGVDGTALQRALDVDLENLRSGNTGKPSFSPPLIEVFEQAWSVATLNLGMTAMSPAVLFLAAAQRGIFLTSSYASVLQSVSGPLLAEGFLRIAGNQAAPLQDQGARAGAHRAVEGRAALEQFCSDFTRLAREGAIDPVLGRDNEIRQALDILSRRRKNNPILVGEAGVGKSAVVEGIALRIAAGDVPEQLKDIELWALDLGLLQAGAGVKGEFEKRLKNVIDAVKGSLVPVVLFIDEAHMLVGAGGAAGQNDAANLLKPALARGEVRTLAATTWSEYRRYFEKDPALARRFQLVKIDEPDETRCIAMMRGIASSYEKHHGVRITYDGIKAAVQLSHRYISGRQLPDKAIDVLDTAGARVKMSQSAKPALLDNAERRLLDHRLERDMLIKDGNAGIDGMAEQIAGCSANLAAAEESVAVLTAQWEREKGIVGKIVDLQNRLVAAREGKTLQMDIDAIDRDLKAANTELAGVQQQGPLVHPNVTAALCADVIADWTGIPVGSMVKDEAQTLLELEGQLTKRILGQDDAIGAICNGIRAAKTGMTNPDAPMGVFLFTGPSGVGKTECATLLADLLFGGEKFLTVINMSEYQESHTVSQLKGAPPGYVGYGEGGILTEAVRQKPYSVLLLDEVEKAHRDVLNLFYQVFDKGFMRDGEGREINFRNTLVIMTSNLGAETIIHRCGEGRGADLRGLIEAVRPQLSAHFQPALLARCTVIPFRPLDTEIMRGILVAKLERLAGRVRTVHSMELSWSPQLVDGLVRSCITVESGARNADAVINQTLLPRISRQLLLAIGDGDQRHIGLRIEVGLAGDFDVSFC